MTLSPETTHPRDGIRNSTGCPSLLGIICLMVSKDDDKINGAVLTPSSDHSECEATATCGQ